jgi:nucleoside-diphosphate-sugar epimerase
MYIGITGATGKIGRWLVHDLVARGHRVRAMVRPTRNGFWGNTTAAVEELRHWGADIFPADFADDASMQRFADGIDVLLHNGYHHVNEEQHPIEWTNLNILASVKLYDAFYKAGGKQIIFISSGAVYGRGPAHELERFPNTYLPIDERTARAPNGLYAAYKSFIEDATVIFKTVHGLKPSTTIRPAGEGVGELLGFRQYDDVGFFTAEAKRLLAGEEVTIQLPPEIVCTDGRNLANAAHLLIEKGLIENADIADWYLAGNAPITPHEFSQIFTEIFGNRKLRIEPIPQERMTSDALIHRLGYQPRGSAATLRDHFIELADKLKRASQISRG